jgi:putative acetyltransferase
MPDITIRIEHPDQPDIRSLIEALDAYLSALYPAESNHLLDIDALAKPDCRFAAARTGGRIAGCGALRLDPAGYGELKRMYVRPEVRGLGLGRRLLAFLESVAMKEGLDRLCLETGIHQPEAIALYRRAGYVERGPFGSYAPDPLSLFMEKRLPASTGA